MALAIASALTVPTPAQASLTARQDPAQHFAACLGRLSAVMEYEWLMGRDGDDARAARGTFEALLDAVAPDSPLPPRDLLHLRIEAKFAHAKLLQAAQFGTDARIRRFATGQAQRAVGQCTDMLLG